MRTPDASNIISRASPRSLKHNSKRKLDLNSLIDQMPDQDFVEISSNKNESEDQKINSKTNDQDTTTTKKRRNSLKQPLTEHQKEMRRKKSFIPVEMQSVSSVLEPTMDSQMSCTTTQDCFENFSMSQVANNNTINETSKAIIEFSLNCKKAPAPPSPAQPQIFNYFIPKQKVRHFQRATLLLIDLDHSTNFLFYVLSAQRFRNQLKNIFSTNKIQQVIII